MFFYYLEDDKTTQTFKHITFIHMIMFYTIYNN